MRCKDLFFLFFSASDRRNRQDNKQDRNKPCQNRSDKMYFTVSTMNNKDITACIANQNPRHVTQGGRGAVSKQGFEYAIEHMFGRDCATTAYTIVPLLKEI